MNKLTISEIQIVPVKPNNGLVAFATAIINNQFYIAHIAIYSAPTVPLGYRLVYPDKTLSNGKRVDCFHPVTQESGKEVSRAIISKDVELMDNFSNVRA